MDDEVLNLLSEYPEFDAEALAKADEETALIVLINSYKAKDNSPFWSFVAVPPTKLLSFRKAQAGGEVFFVEDYGEIIATGEGKEPPVEIIKEMHEKYGLDPNFEKKAVAEFEKFKAKKKEEKLEKSLLDKIAGMKKKKPEEEN